MAFDPSGAWRDIVGGFSQFHVWGILGWQDIRQRYRRSVLGPFWVTISMALMTLSMGFLYAHLFGQSLSEYLPFLTIGLVVWGAISGFAIEGCQTFISADAMIKQVKLPLTVHVWRTVWRNLILFAHNAIVIVVVLAIFGTPPQADVLLVPVALTILVVNGWWIGVVLGTISARYRDVPQLAASILQMLFFLTPVMWKIEALGDKVWIVAWNPAFHLIQIVRAPLLGEPIPSVSWVFAIAFTVLGALGAFLMLARSRARIAYWV